MTDWYSGPDPRKTYVLTVSNSDKYIKKYFIEAGRYFNTPQWSGFVEAVANTKRGNDIFLRGGILIQLEEK